MVKGINAKKRQDIERKIRTILRNARDFDLNEEDIKLALRNISKKEIEKVEKELTVKSVEDVVGLKHVVKRHEDTMNKDMAYVYKTALDCLYGLLKLEGYSKSHLNKVIYSETFEYKGIKY